MYLVSALRHLFLRGTTQQMSKTVKDLVTHYHKETRGNLNIPTIKSRLESDLILLRGLRKVCLYYEELISGLISISHQCYPLGVNKFLKYLSLKFRIIFEAKKVIH